MPDLITHQFLLPKTRQSMKSSLREILDFINSYVQGSDIAETINFKAKIIIAELLTNAIKHAGNTETTIQVSMNKEGIYIEKKDFGNPFNPNNLALLLNDVGYKVQLSKDDLHTIYAVVESENKVRFICEENDDSIPDLNDIMEHFGILIITKSADEFTYQHDYLLGLNTFYVRLQLY